MAKLAIGLPVYNGERYLGKTLKAFLDQTFTDFEIVICDNASTDRTAEICQLAADRDRRVRYVLNESNIGAARNYDKTFQISDSEYFRWAAADDYVAPTYLEKCVGVLDAERDVVLCNTYTVLVDEDDEPLPYDAEREGFIDRAGLKRVSPVNGPKGAEGDADERLRDVLAKTPPCYDVFGVVRRAAMAKTSLHGNWYGSDRAFMAEMALMGRLHLIPEVLFYYREHAGQSVMLGKKARKAWIGPQWVSHLVPEGASLRLQLAWRSLCAPMSLSTKGRCVSIMLFQRDWNDHARLVAA